MIIFLHNISHLRTINRTFCLLFYWFRGVVVAVSVDEDFLKNILWCSHVFRYKKNVQKRRNWTRIQKKCFYDNLRVLKSFIIIFLMWSLRRSRCYEAWYSDLIYGIFFSIIENLDQCKTRFSSRTNGLV